MSNSPDFYRTTPSLRPPYGEIVAEMMELDIAKDNEAGYIWVVISGYAYEEANKRNIRRV